MDLSKYTHDNKRIKLNSTDPSRFQNGNIITLKLQNFVTYTLAEFAMTPSLNMIIGPNGSGKSTVVCAICLGLAGKTEYLGRASDAASYVKNGCPYGTIEITLRDTEAPNGEFSIIKRRLMRDKRGGGSEYWLNDKQCSEQVIKQYVRGMNIQLDNLCQFLSQERVEKFAALKPVMLLHETVRAIDINLLNHLEQLKLLQENELTSAKEIDISGKRLDELLRQKAKLDENIRSIREYELKNESLKRHQFLLPYTYLKDHKEKLESFKKDYKFAKQQLKILIQKKKKFQSSTDIIHENENSTNNELNNITKLIEDQNEMINKNKISLKNLRDSIIKKQNQIEYYKNRANKIKEKIKSTEDTLQERKQILQSIDLPDPEKFKTISEKRNQIIIQQQSTQQTINSMNDKARTIDRQITALKDKIQRKKMSQTNYDKIDLLDNPKRPDLKTIRYAMLDIRKISKTNPECGQQILGPPLITISAKEPSFAPYLSSAIPFATAIALTVTSDRAFDLYADPIVKKFPVNLRQLSNNQLQEPISRDELIERYGFEGYLSDFIKGDKKVIQMLCEFHKIHMIPVSRKELPSSQLEPLMKPQANGKPLFSQIIHGKTLITLNVSQTNQVYARSRNIESNANSQFYASSVMSDELKASINREIEDMTTQVNTHSKTLEEQINEKNDVTHQLKEYGHEFDKLNNELSGLNNIRNKHSKFQNDCNLLEENLEKYKQDARRDVSLKIEDVKHQITEDLKVELKLAQEMIKLVTTRCTMEEQHITQQANFFKFKNMSLSMNGLIESLNAEEDELDQEYRTKKNNFEERKNSREYLEWKKQIETYEPDLKEKLAELAEEYDKEDNFTISFINDTIDKLESEISRLNHDASSVKIIETVEKEIKQLEEVLPGQQKKLAETREEMNNKRSILEPKLDEIIEMISKKFADLFKRVGSAGAIRLNKPDLFTKWEIEILVKFRDNAVLKQLDPHTQSGGERAVSTVLYMMALQDFTTAPFRVVDEINQGMDRRNERIVHKAMVENACKENTSQYFLITPKLLTDLYYHERMRIHCVMAGPWIPNPSVQPEMQHFGETSNYVL
ncbi:similar to Saccharomyces cerevisiae YOL034W SMC5 Structural maintenance of chromosomes (SMC) protein [Maudiozyma saulgeensis]|uniref:Structural maintenance of chromosomes protein 5 n=1 Tax=Maudiozyma saulgeensis TaxID=1789683 RepID=A0A1X7R3G9_9SACH|nr:similar to Saccharomyces cerevisiae YOL034W SMC5 Structural maintenance of chromosomes (SMC) protein [Kazachstania saulgeensis]